MIREAELIRLPTIIMNVSCNIAIGRGALIDTVDPGDRPLNRTENIYFYSDSV